MSTQTQTECCPLVHECSFYQRSNSYMPNVSNRLRDEYCLQDQSHCACMEVHQKLGSEWVPLSMMPYQNEWAQQILSDICRDDVELFLQHAIAGFTE